MKMPRAGDVLGAVGAILKYQALCVGRVTQLRLWTERLLRTELLCFVSGSAG